MRVILNDNRDSTMLFRSFTKENARWLAGAFFCLNCYADMRFALFSQVSPTIHERLGFRVLPDAMQHCKPALAMITGEGKLGPREQAFLREYF